MAEEAEQQNIEAQLQPVDDDNDEITPGYKPPAPKSLDEIKNLDEDDESLRKYKQNLLATGEVLDEGGNNVLVKKLVFRTDGRPDIILDLTGDLSKLKSKPIVIKEGVGYRIVVAFRVQYEIVSGLRYVQHTFRKGMRVEKSNLMVGSYGPQTEEQEFCTPTEDAPKGMVARGHYTVKSKFTDDDKNIYLEWEWSFDIKKEWD